MLLCNFVKTKLGFNENHKNIIAKTKYIKEFRNMKRNRIKGAFDAP